MGLSIESFEAIEGRPFARFVARHPGGECREISIVHPLCEMGYVHPPNRYYDPVANVIVRVKRKVDGGTVFIWRN